MPAAMRAWRGVGIGLAAFLGVVPGLFASALIVLAAAPAHGQSAVSRDDIVNQLNHFEEAPTLDIPALKQQVTERSKSRSRTEPPPQKRPPIAPALTSLPTFNVDIQFDPDTPIVRPESYAAVGRIADAMVQSSMLPYTFLIVGHIEGNGRRESNVILSQRRADAIREILTNTFKISSKRLLSIGLGEEQLLDPARPTGPVNQQLQIMTVAKQEQSELPEHPAPAAATAPARKPAKKR